MLEFFHRVGKNLALELSDLALGSDTHLRLTVGCVEGSVSSYDDQLRAEPALPKQGLGHFNMDPICASAARALRPRGVGRIRTVPSYPLSPIQRFDPSSVTLGIRRRPLELRYSHASSSPSYLSLEPRQLQATSSPETMSPPKTIERAHLLRASFESILAETANTDLIARASAILEGLAERDEESAAVCEAIARVVGNRLEPDAIVAWLDSAAELGPGGSWVAARLAARAKDRALALSHWDRVVDRGTGPHLERYLGRARVRERAGDIEGAAADLREAFHHPAGYGEMERGAKLLKRLRKHEFASKRQIKIGLLGGFTTQLIRPLLDLACFRDGIDATLYEAEFGIFRQEILDPSSELRSFEPDVVILATSWRDANLAPTTDDPATVAKSMVDGFEALWKICADEMRAHVIQHNFDVPAIDSYGQLSLSLTGGRARTLLAANLELLDRATSGVSILDFDGVAARFGKARWNDSGLWYRAKQHLSPEAVPELVDEYAMHIRALLGLSKKCLVLDLDNTVWGGVIGEDGIDGIELGGHSPEGEAHAELQRYASELRGRGIVLAVCSKNNDADAREPFERHPEMVLSLDDIAVFQANWQDKATNLREIANALQRTRQFRLPR